jgi:hypothetical protein
MRRSVPPHCSQIEGPSEAIGWMTSITRSQERHW